MTAFRTALRIGLPLALTILAAAIFCAVAAPSALATSTLTVNVCGQDTKAPLSDVAIELYRKTDSGVWVDAGSRRTGMDSMGGAGSATFWELAAGTYCLRAFETTGFYASCFWNSKFTRSSADRIEVPGNAFVTQDIELPVAGHIAGTVTDKAGIPLEGIYMYALNATHGGGLACETYTAADGSYDIGGLLAADNWILELQDLHDQIYIYEYWKGVRMAQNATPIVVASGATTTLDVQMRKSATISGVVTTRLGLACSEVVVEAYARTASGGWVDVSGMCCDADGSFTIRQLPPGRYSIAFYDPSHPERQRYYPDTGLRCEAKILRLDYGEAVDIHQVVWSDSIKPTPQAPVAETVTRGSSAAVRYRIKDPRPGGPTADVTIKVRTRSGATVKTVVLPRRKVNAWLTGRFVCGLKRGTYVFKVYAVDSGGNRQTKPAANTLRVR